MTPLTFMQYRAFPQEAADFAILDIDDVYKFPVPAQSAPITLKFGTLTPVAFAPDAATPTARLTEAVLAAVPIKGTIEAPTLDVDQKLRRLAAVRAVLGAAGDVPMARAFNDQRTPVVNHLVAIATRAYGLDSASVIDCLAAIKVDVTPEQVAACREDGPYDGDEAGKALDAIAELQARQAATAAEEARKAHERATTRTTYTGEDFPGVAIFVRTNDMDLRTAGMLPNKPIGLIDRIVPSGTVVRVLPDTNETIIAARTLGINWPGGEVCQGLRVIGPNDEIDLTSSEAHAIRTAPIFHGISQVEELRRARRASRTAMSEGDYIQPGTAEFKSAKAQFSAYIEALRPQLEWSVSMGGVLPVAEMGARGLRLLPDVVSHMLTTACAVDGKPHMFLHQAHWDLLITMAISAGPHHVDIGELLKPAERDERGEPVDHDVDIVKRAVGAKDMVSRHDVVTALKRAGSTHANDSAWIASTMDTLGFELKRVGSGAQRRRMWVRKSLAPGTVATPEEDDDAPDSWQPLGASEAGPTDEQRIAAYGLGGKAAVDKLYGGNFKPAGNAFADIEAQVAEYNERAAVGT